MMSLDISRAAAIALAAIFLVAGIGGAGAETLRQIEVSGEGMAAVEPDMARISVGVQVEAETPEAAMDQASAAVQGVYNGLAEADLPSEQIKSGVIRLIPRYSNSTLASARRIIGYQAVNTIDIEVFELEDLGSVLAGLVENGANRIDSVSFDLQDPQAAYDLARQRAAQDGARKAALYANTLDLDLGVLLRLSEIGGGGYRPVMAEARQFDSAASLQYDVPTAPGLIELQASVTMTYAIATEN